MVNEALHGGLTCESEEGQPVIEVGRIAKWKRGFNDNA